MKKFKLTKIKEIKITIGKETIILKDREEIRQTLQGNPFLKNKIDLEVDDIQENDCRNF